MDLAMIAAQQVIALFFLILAGFVVTKIGALPIQGKKVISDLLIYLVMPAMIINSFIRDYDPNTLHNLLQTFWLSAILLVGGAVATIFVTARMKGDDRYIFRFACIFSNAGYMGIPLIRALFGEESLLYASAFLAVFNLLIHSFGYATVNRNATGKEIIHSISHNPCMISVCIGLLIYLLQIPIPHVIAQPIGMVGDMTTPISMILTGMTIAGSNLKRLLSKKQILGICAIRLLLIPVLALGLFRIMGVAGMVPTVVLIQQACPCAAVTTVYAVQFDHDEDLAAGAVVFSTLLSILTLPVYIFIISAMLG